MQKMENNSTNQIQQINQPIKRNTAFKLRIGSILNAKQVTESEKLKHIEIADKQISRVNVIANVIEKYIQEGERKFGSITLDDATGQLKVKSFGDDVDRFFSKLNQGDTISLIGFIRSWNNELYIAPEIIKNKDIKYLLVRKLEIEAEESKIQDKTQLFFIKNKILDMLKEAEKDDGIDIEKIILGLKESPDTINQEIKKLLEDGVAYEPRPGRIRWLG